jgi:hypothetical protein
MTCGDAEVSFDHLWFAIGAWSQLSSPEGLALITVDQQWTIISSIPQRVNHLMVMFREQLLKGQTETSKLHPLHNLLRRTCSCLASNPRDKVYGVLGLIEEGEADLAPDYNRSVVQVFTDVVVMHTRATMKLSIIGFRTNTFSHGIRTPGLPSWVPDLSSTQDAARPFVNWNFHSAEATAAQYQFSDDFKVLTARGIIADEIDAIEPNRDFAHHSEILNCWLKFAAVSSRQLHPTGIPWRQAFFRAIVGDESGYAYGRSGFRNNEHRKVFYEHAVAFILLIGKELFGKSKVRNNGERETDGEEGMKSIEHMFRDQGLDSLAKPFFLLSTEVPDTKSQVYTATLLKEFLGQPGMKGHMDSSLINIPEINKPKSKGASFLVLFREVIVQRNLFFTKRGYMGLAPIGAKEGDRVCVLHGLESPLIVRPQDDYYLVVGGSYIYGMMNGEVMQDV